MPVLSKEVRIWIITLVSMGFSQREVADELIVSKSSVQKWFKRFGDSGSIDDHYAGITSY